MDIQQTVANFRTDFQNLRKEIGKVIVGHAEIVDGVLIALFCGGHALLEGVPGLGKTMLIRTLSSALDLAFSRIQFTPDLMPADIIGTNIVMENEKGERSFQFQKGPIFAQMVLADEINRATPKTQSALLEAMQEHSVTVGGKNHRLVEPFFVMATQNPIEMEGTYPLPEAQLDRFLVKLIVHFSGLNELKEILNRTTENVDLRPEKVVDAGRILQWQKLVKDTVAAPPVKDFVARIILASHPKSPFANETVNKYVRFGSSPRGAQSILLTSKVYALLDGRYNTAFEDVKKAAFPALRHRLILNFEAEAEGVNTDTIIESILAAVPTESAEAVGARK